MNSLSFSASATISSVEGICSGCFAFAWRISLASCRSSSLISYGVLLDNVVSSYLVCVYLSDYSIKDNDPVNFCSRLNLLRNPWYGIVCLCSSNSTVRRNLSPSKLKIVCGTCVLKTYNLFG